MKLIGRFFFMLINCLFSATCLAQEVKEKSSLPLVNSREKQFEYEDPNMREFVHFELALNDKVKEDAIYKAVHHFARVEMYRFVDNRRRILLSDDLGFVVLYSAKELLQQTGRAIRPQNIRDEDIAADVMFVFTDQGVIKEQLVTRK